MAEARITSEQFTGATAAATIVDGGDTLRYLALYAQTGSCVVSFGPLADHADNAIIIAEGNMMEFSPIVNTGMINYSGDATFLVVLSA